MECQHKAIEIIGGWNVNNIEILEEIEIFRISMEVAGMTH
jgi:hypothetical protein